MARMEVHRRCKQEAILHIRDSKDVLGPSALSNRRQWLTSVVLGMSGVVVLPSQLWATENGLSHAAEAIHQEPVFKASPKRIYEALTDPKQLEAKPAEISREPGGAFSLFGGYIVGRQIELMPNQRIVEAWREITWEPGWFSIVRFEFKEQGMGTRLIFDHT